MNKKELIIIVYKVNVKNMSIQSAEEYLQSMIKNFSLSNDEYLKENYAIKEIFLPIVEDRGETDVKVIYPIPKYTTSPEINNLVNEISLKIKEDPTNVLKSHWERLVRELKLRKINE